MASWHEKDCRRPDVVLMDNTPTCLSCGSLFFQDDDEAQEQLSKQTAVVDKASSLLNLDWPSSITFSSPDDVTDPDLRTILLNMDRYAEVSDLDTASELTPSEFEAFMDEHATTGPEGEHCAVAGNSQGVEESLTVDEPTDGFKPQISAQNFNSDTDSTIAKLDITGQNAVYHSLMGTDEIRLLHLDPYDTISQPLHGCLRPTRLSQRPDYIALSYTWADQNGDRTLCHNIFIGNAWTPFAITSNCAAALRRLRLRGGTRIIWIDAICIDQTNTGERSHQVSMMRDIYSRAESVAIYLGGDRGQDVDTPAGRLMQRLSDERFRAGKAVSDNWGGGFDYHGINDLFGQPYWSRIWVIQEVLLARKAEIILGNASIPLHEFISNFMKKLPPSVESLLPLWIYSLGGSRSGDVDAFSHLLHKTSTCQASDKRDMVFALFGLVQGAGLEGLVADYSKTMAEIYTGLAAYFLIRHGQSGLLKAAASASTSARRAAMYRIQGSKHPKFRVPRFMVSQLNIQGSQERDQNDHIWLAKLPSWVPFANSSDPHDVELFQDNEPPEFDFWYRTFGTVGRELGPNEAYRLTELKATGYAPPQQPLSSCKVFGKHGTLLVRALPVVHMSYMGSALLHGAFASSTKAIYSSNIYVLTATGTSMRWEIWVHSSAGPERSDDWIVEVPGCDTFLHLKPSGQVPGTYRLVSTSSVVLFRNFITQPNQGSITDNDSTDMLDLATESWTDRIPRQREIDNAKSRGQSGQFFENALSHVGDAAEDYRIWMPLISCGLHHLLFLRHWESITRTDMLLAPRQPGPDEPPAELSPEILEEYGRWLDFKTTPNSGDGLHDNEFDSVVRSVSLYLERWDDRHLWSRIHDIVVEVPWQAKLQELADIKADVWQYLAARDPSTAGHGRTWDAIRWESSLQELFEDLLVRLPGIPLRATEGVWSIGSFLSRDTWLSLRDSIKNIPDSWNLDKIRIKEVKIFKVWTEVEASWEFMERSKADCHALRGKFVQLCALKRLCRREYRDFLIC